MKRCERCGATSPNDEAGAFALFDYCAECSKDLCDECMAKGCCGHVPARSGAEDDYSPLERRLSGAARSFRDNE